MKGADLAKFKSTGSNDERPVAAHLAVLLHAHRHRQLIDTMRADGPRATLCGRSDKLRKHFAKLVS